jgi:hypothetical protein
MKFTKKTTTLELEELSNLGFVVDGDAELTSKGYRITGDITLATPYKELPVKFDTVTGDFGIDSKRLVTLKGCPETVGGNFDACYNKLESLDYMPATIGGRCDLRGNPKIKHLLENGLPATKALRLVK